MRYAMPTRNGSWLLAGLLLFVLAPACAGSDTVTLEDLVEYPASYDGRTVVVEGEVATLEDPRHYWIEDDDFNRVGVEPEDDVADHVGERVRVQGTFSYHPDEGRSIRIDEISLVADADQL